jgi:hypothetical protein
MKAMLAALVATPLVGFSSLTFAQEPIVLSQAEMDSVTAAGSFINVSDIYVKNNQVQVVGVGGFVLQHQ